MSLKTYESKRSFAGADATPEPRHRSRPDSQKNRPPIFVVQLHRARSRHYDFRLEHAGALKSWAIPKGPSLDPGVKRLAVEVEDHPVSYADFEGDIPHGHYGAGHVDLFDRGTWSSDEDVRKQLDKGHLRFTLDGTRLRGAWNLVRTQRKARQPPRQIQWLLMKVDDAEAGPASADDLLDSRNDAPPGLETVGKTQSRKSGTAKPPRSRTPANRKCAGTRAPMPAGAFAPALCKPLNRTPATDDWLHEIKWDGYRILATIAGDGVRLWSRNAIEWTKKLPDIARALRGLGLESAQLDGELIALDGARSDFNLLKARLAGENRVPLAYELFDLPYLDGRDLSGLPLLQRKAALERLLERHPHRALRYSAHVTGGGASAFRQAQDNGLEGVVSKRIDSPYRAGRSGDWVKTKGRASDEFLVVGYTAPKGARTALGSLLLARGEGTRLHYAGRCGTGFDDALLRQLSKTLQTLAVDTPPVKTDALEPRVRATVRWVEPRMVVEVYHASSGAGLGGQGLLRHPVFKSIREDKNVADIVVPKMPAARRAGRAGKKTRGHDLEPEPATEVNISHPDRLMFPDAGISKADVADYYRAVMPWFLPAIADRPLSVVRCPDGVGQQIFFQKHPGKGWGRDIHGAPAQRGRNADAYLYVSDPAGVLELVQMNVIEFHPWGATVADPDHADRLVFDLDPDGGVPWRRVAQAAVRIRDLLDGIGLRSFLRTTGGKGLHVVVPLAPAAPWEQAKDFARSVATLIAQENPEEFVAVAAKARREGRIFIDWLRNGRSATSVASYSLRARPGAKVAVPLGWDELPGLKSADRFDLQSTRRRLARLKADPWGEVVAVEQSLAQVQKRLARI